MTKRLIRVLLAVILTASVPLSAETVAMVVHPDSKVTTISKAELSRIFLRRLRTWADGTMAVPVDQLPSSDVREEFSRRVHGRSVVTVEVYWKRMIFSGRSVPPRELAGDEAVIEFVRSTPGAVGYVSSADGVVGVKELSVKDE